MCSTLEGYLWNQMLEWHMEWDNEFCINKVNLKRVKEKGNDIFIND
jgi:hypothetical protein